MTQYYCRSLNASFQILINRSTYYVQNREIISRLTVCECTFACFWYIIADIFQLSVSSWYSGYRYIVEMLLRACKTCGRFADALYKVAKSENAFPWSRKLSTMSSETRKVEVRKKEQRKQIQTDCSTTYFMRAVSMYSVKTSLVLFNRNGRSKWTTRKSITPGSARAIIRCCCYRAHWVSKNIYYILRDNFSKRIQMNDNEFFFCNLLPSTERNL